MWRKVTGTQIIAAFGIVAFSITGLTSAARQHQLSVVSRLACQSNLKQLGVAYIQYEQDNDGKFPPGTASEGRGWAGQVYPYLQSTYAFQCPSDTHQGRYISYTENKNLAGIKFNGLADASTTVELYESSTLGCDPSLPETVSETGVTIPRGSRRHDMGTYAPYSLSPNYVLNFLFADGHIQTLKPDCISPGPGYATFNVK